MGVVSTTVTITSAADSLVSSAISISNSKDITAPNTNGLARGTITATSKGASGEVTIYTADDYAAIAYVYIKNTDSTSTDYVYVYNDTTSGDPIILKLAGGDWAFLPTVADKTLKAYATTSGTIVEHMVFGTDQ
jgi:hypothetical protein